MSIVKDFIGILKWGQSISTWANTSSYYVNYNVEKGALSSLAAATWCRLIFQTTKHIFSKNYYILYLLIENKDFSATRFCVLSSLYCRLWTYGYYIAFFKSSPLLYPAPSFTDDCSPILSGLEGTMQGSSKDLYWF